MPKTKKQHYIPQFYLKHFSYDKEKIYCIEKPIFKGRLVSIKDTAEENYFYDLNISKLYESFSDKEKNEIDKICTNDMGKKYSELTQEEKDKLDQSIENFLSESIETPLSSIFRKIINNTYNFNEWVVRNCLFINENEKKDMAYYLAVSYIRSKAHRDFIAKSFVNINKSIIPIMAQFYGLEIRENDINISISKEAQKMYQIKSITDYETCSRIASIFLMKRWVLCENLTNIKFVTCDDPFIILPLKKPKYPFYGIGLASPGVAIGFPITSKLLLMMYDSIEYSFIKDKSIIIERNASNIIDFNLAMINNAHTYIYVEDEKMLKLVEELGEKHPSIKEKCIKMLTSS